MSFEDLVNQFAEDIQFDALKDWCSLFDVEYQEPPCDDMYPDWESELRGKLAEAMMKVEKR
ncbi:hypothetical protein LCGC14_0743290 [marine sediment metagenome]|uniref:Uncharacterized protein n=1 Tax=marine sediment metagenome TaxID=412755 RepID=A0A0F9QAB1_9ZZZZ